NASAWRGPLLPSHDSHKLADAVRLFERAMDCSSTWGNAEFFLDRRIPLFDPGRYCSVGPQWIRHSQDFLVKLRFACNVFRERCLANLGLLSGPKPKQIVTLEMHARVRPLFVERVELDGVSLSFLVQFEVRPITRWNIDRSAV